MINMNQIKELVKNLCRMRMYAAVLSEMRCSQQGHEIKIIISFKDICVGGHRCLF